MKLLKSLALQAPNVWDRSPVLEVWLAADGKGSPGPIDLTAVERRIVALAQPHLQVGELPAAGRLDAGNELPPAWLEYLTRKLQALCGVKLPVGRVAPAPQAGVCLVGIHYEDEGLVRAALDVAVGSADGRVGRHALRFRHATPLAPVAGQRAVHRAEHGGHRARRPSPAYSGPPAEREQLRPVRRRQPAAPDLHRRNGEHRRHRRIDRPGQGIDQGLVGQGRRARAAGHHRHQRGRSLASGLRFGAASRGQAARRQSWSRRGDPPDRARADHGGLRDRCPRGERCGDRAVRRRPADAAAGGRQ